MLNFIRRQYYGLACFQTTNLLTRAFVNSVPVVFSVQVPEEVSFQGVLEAATKEWVELSVVC